MTKDDIITAEEICETLHIKLNTLHSKKWRQEVQIPVYKQGKYLFSFKNDFWKWYKQRAIA